MNEVVILQRFTIKYMLRDYLNVSLKSQVYIRQPKDTLLCYQVGEQGWGGSFHVATTSSGIFMISSLVIIFSQILKKASSKSCICNVVNEVKAF